MQTQAWLHETILVVHEHASLMCISQFRTTISRATGLSALTIQNCLLKDVVMTAGVCTLHQLG